MSNHTMATDTFGTLSPQQFILIYGFFFGELMKDKHPFYYSDKTQGHIEGEIGAAKNNTIDWLCGQLQKGEFSNREKTAGERVVNDIGYDFITHIFTFSSETRNLMFKIAVSGIGSIKYQQGQEKVLEAVISVDSSDKSFNYYSVGAGAELRPPIIKMGSVEGDLFFAAQLSTNLSEIRHRVSDFYTEWLRGQLKILARENEARRLDMSATGD